MELNFEEITDSFSSQIAKIESSSPNVLQCAKDSISLSRKVLHNFKVNIQNTKFKSVDSEIDFFKNIKQVPLVPLIYFSEVRSFELQFPLVDNSSQKKYINKKIKKLNRFFSHNIDFIQYVTQGNSHFDKHYFTRKHSDTYHIVSSKFYFQDPDFTTARDMLLGKVKAYQKFILYLKQKLQNGINNDLISSLTLTTQLKWTASKAALTELVYALYASGVLNNGNADIKEIAVALQKVFHFDLGDFYKIYAEIKFRKNSRTKFLDKATTSLISLMNESER